MAKLTVCTLDIESFWSQTHSLSRMSPIVYCTHPETEIISLAYKFNDGETSVIFGEDNIAAWVRSVDWSDKLVVAHNCGGFDAMPLAWRFNLRPRLWGDTLSMSKPIHAKEAGGSLAALVKHYELGVKDQSALIQTKGRHLKDFTPEEIAAMGEYNKADVDQCWGLFKKLLPLTSKDEMKLIDMTIRMLVEPQFVVDRALLAKTLFEERDRKAQMLLSLAVTIGVWDGTPTDYPDGIANEVCKTLGSAAKFSKLLEDLGVEVPTKISPTTGKTTPALAKTDEAFVALQEHDNPIVAAAACARLGVKSTLLESRIEAFLEAADATGGKMPIALTYFGGHTGRWSGTFSLNQQNLPRVSGKPTDALRNCLKAPNGYKIVVSDLSGIELRVNHFLWKVPSSMALYQADPDKADLYKDFASMLYDVPREDVTKAQRTIGKLAHLGLGFSAGAVTFQRIAKNMGGVDLSLDEARVIVAKWREAYKEIAQGWRACQNSLRSALLGAEREVDPWGLCYTAQNRIYLPSGRFINYPALREEVTESDGKKSWLYGEGRHKAFLTGGKVDENLVQAIARDVIAEQALQIKARTGFSPIHMVHDELIYCVPEDQAEHHLSEVYEVMRTPPKWWPELILSCEGDIGDNYGSCK